MFYLFCFAVPFCRKVITISGNSDLRRYAAENQIENAMSDVRYPLIKPYHFYFDQTIQSRVVKGTNPALKKPSNIPEIYAKMIGRSH